VAAQFVRFCFFLLSDIILKVDCCRIVCLGCDFYAEILELCCDFDLVSLHSGNVRICWFFL